MRSFLIATTLVLGLAALYNRAGEVDEAVISGLLDKALR